MGDLRAGTVNYRDVSYVHLLPEQETHSAFLSASQQLGERVELLANVRYSHREMRSLSPGETFSVSVPSTNPFYVNPFGGTGPVTVEYDFTRDLGPNIQTGTTEGLAADLSATVRLLDDWRVTFSGSYGEESTDWVWLNLRNNTAMVDALRDTNPATALNVFGDGSFTNPATIDAIRTSKFENSESNAWSVAAIADGPIADLPGGVAKLAVGADYRGDDWEGQSNTNYTAVTGNSRKVKAVFTELSVPFVGEANALSGVQYLALSLAGRYDDYNDFGATFNPKVGLAWRPFSVLGLRGSWGTSFRAPPFNLSNPAIVGNISNVSNRADPRAAVGTTTRSLVQRGVVPDLKEETADVWTAGLDLTPTGSLAASFTYFDIDYRDKIQSPNLATLFQLEDQYAGTGVITRNPTPQQINDICSLPSFTGACDNVLAILDIRLRNVAVVRVKGLDLELAQLLQTDVGQFNFGVRGTYTLSYDQGITAVSPQFDVVDTYGSPLALRLRGTLGWTLRGWMANAAVNYSGGYDDTRTVPARPIGSWTTMDVGAGYRFPVGAGWFSDTRLLLNANNVFDKFPPFVNSYEGYDGANASLIGRTLSLQVVKDW